MIKDYSIVITQYHTYYILHSTVCMYFSTGGLHSPCIWVSHPAGCSLQPSPGGQTPCLRGTSCHQQPLGRTEATDEAALHTVCFWRVMEVASQRITTYIALHMSSCTIWKQVPVLKQNTVTKLTTQTIQQCCLTNWTVANSMHHFTHHRLRQAYKTVLLLCNRCFW